MRNLGADTVIDYRTQRFEEAVRDADAVIDLVGVTSQQLSEIAGLIDGGELRTHVGAVLPLADVLEAHLMLEQIRPRPKGKIVLAVGAS